jgi:8-oxo-dGTP pyrophosphatase MutT (NUDIX family)/phosphohistidine phosphatase SixA
MPDNKPPGSKLIRAAGAVAWRPGPDGGEPEVLLVHRKKYDDWSLPKGKAEPGELLPVTAVREVLEESGARLVLGRRLTSVRYQVSGRPKRVHYWAARVTGTDEAAVPNAEVDQVDWATPPAARSRVSYARDASVLDDFARLPAATVPLILLRHARAVPKPGWDRDDAARPLDDAGRADAAALAGLLACFAPAARVLSSPALRCLESVRPYAGLSGGTVQAAPALYVQSFRTDGGDSAAALVSDAVAAGEPAVICAHRENLPVLRAAAAAALGAGGPGGRPLPGDWDEPLPTAGCWVLHARGGALVAADRYDLSDT